MAKDVTRTDQAPQRRPLDLLDAMRSDMERVFDRFEHGWPSFGGLGFGTRLAPSAVAAHMDVRDDGDMIIVETDLPGVEDKDVTVTLANGVLTIKGEKKSEREEKDKSYYLAERSYGSFERSLRLPDTIDEAKLEARFEKGVLKVTAPKKPEALKAEKKIEIKNG